MPLASRIGLLRAALQLELPISRWELDEVAGSAFADLGAAAVPMSHVGTWADLTTESLVQGLGGTSAYTDGGAYATAASGVAAHNLSELTLSFYYQRDSAAAKHVLLVCGDGAQAGDLSIEVLANGRLRGWHTGQDVTLRFFEGSGGVVGTDLAVGTAHRIDLALGPLGARLYLDGAALPAAAILANTNGWNNGRVKYLGRYSDGVQGGSIGAFDRVRLWPRQLSPAEIATLAPARRIQLPGFRFIEAEAGHLVATGYDAELRLRPPPLVAATGHLVATGHDAGLLLLRRLAAATGHLVATGHDAGLLHHRRLAAAAGHLVATGYDAELIARTNVLAAATGHLVATGYDAVLLHHRRLAAEAGHLVATGYDAVLRRRPAPLVAEAGHLVATGHDAGLTHVRRLVAETGHLMATGYDAELSKLADIEFVASSAVKITSGNATTHTQAYALTNGSGSTRKLIAVSGVDGSLVTGFSYNGITALEAEAVSDNEGADTQAAAYYLDGDDLPDDTSSHDGVWSTAGSIEIIGRMLEYDNVANGAPEDTDTQTTGEPGAGSGTVTASEGALVLQVLCGGTASTSDDPAADEASVGAGQTERMDARGTATGAMCTASDIVGVAAGNKTPTTTPGAGQARQAVITMSFAKAA